MSARQSDHQGDHQGAGRGAALRPWDELSPQEKTAAVTPLARAGLSAAEMAARLTTPEHQVTRCAVIGACHRAGLAIGGTQRTGVAARAGAGAGAGAVRGAGRGDRQFGSIVGSNGDRRGARADGAGADKAPADLARPDLARPDQVRKRGPVNFRGAEQRWLEGDEARAPARVPAPRRLSDDERAALPLSQRPGGRGVSLMELTAAMCRWPLGQEGDRAELFCGAEKAHGAYCVLHGKAAYVPLKRRGRA